MTDTIVFETTGGSTLFTFSEERVQSAILDIQPQGSVDDYPGFSKPGWQDETTLIEVLTITAHIHRDDDVDGLKALIADLETLAKNQGSEGNGQAAVLKIWIDGGYRQSDVTIQNIKVNLVGGRPNECPVIITCTEVDRDMVDAI